MALIIDYIPVSGLQCEWAKSKARADRWSEEVLLLAEEMRRVICFLDWKASWWVMQAAARTDLPQDIKDGIIAYVSKQAHINRSLAKDFAVRWRPILLSGGFTIEWPSLYMQGEVGADRV
jgi:hypothetical protein